MDDKKTLDSAISRLVALGISYDATRKSHDALEARLLEILPLLREAHDELVSLKSHRILLVAALIGHVREIEAL